MNLDIIVDLAVLEMWKLWCVAHL